MEDGDLPGDPLLAWQWRQLNDELDARARTSLKDLQERILRLSTALQQITAKTGREKSGDSASQKNDT